MRKLLATLFLLEWLFVNQKIIDGLTYTAYRDSDNPKLEIIQCGDKSVNVRLRDVWRDDEKIKVLFNKS